MTIRQGRIIFPSMVMVFMLLFFFGCKTNSEINEQEMCEVKTETDGTNTLKTVQVKGLPDLIISNLRCVANCLGHIRAYATVTNVGQEVANPFRIRFFYMCSAYDDATVIRSSKHSLGPGRSREIVALFSVEIWPWDLAEHFTMDVYADTYNEVEESNENNNSKIKSYNTPDC